MANNNWKNFFDTIAPVYEKEIFTRNTLAEIDFIEEVLQLPHGAAVLDLGCGTGRHAIELARRGYRVTGVDISGGMLEVARRNAAVAGVDVEFVESPAQKFAGARRYDCAISLCEGALCLFSEEDDIWAKDMGVFACMAEHLLPEKPFLITVLSAFRMIRSLTDEQVAAGAADLCTLTTRNPCDVDVDGRNVSIQAIERYYTPPEIVRMVNRVGLKVDHIWGGTAGNWRRGPISLDEFEFMVVGHRKTDDKKKSHI